MRLFNKRKKTPDELTEKANAKAVKLAERLEEENRKKEAKLHRVRKLNIDGDNPDVNYHKIDLSMKELQVIFERLHKIGRYSGCYGEAPEDQSNPSRYRVYEVQALMDYAIGCRRALTWMQKQAITGGIAHYDDDGKFKYNKEEKGDE